MSDALWPDPDREQVAEAADMRRRVRESPPASDATKTPKVGERHIRRVFNGLEIIEERLAGPHVIATGLEWADAEILLVGYKRIAALEAALLEIEPYLSGVALHFLRAALAKSNAKTAARNLDQSPKPLPPFPSTANRKYEYHEDHHEHELGGEG